MINEYPYTDFNEYNMDWIIKTIKDLTVEWASMKDDWESLEHDFQDLKNYVDNYFDNLDLQAQVNIKLEEMASDGTLALLIRPYFQDAIDAVPSVVTEWLDDHIDPDLGYVIDDTLRIKTAAADALAAGQVGRLAEFNIDRNTNIKNVFDGFYVQGSINASTGVFESSATALRIGPIDLTGANFISIRNIPTGYTAGSGYLYFYQGDDTFINRNRGLGVGANMRIWDSTSHIPAAASYCYFVINHNDGLNPDMDPLDICINDAWEGNYDYFVRNLENNEKTFFIGMQNYIYNVGGNYWNVTTNRIGTNHLYISDDDLIIYTDASHSYALLFYDANVYDNAHKIYQGGWTSGKATYIPKGTYFNVNFKVNTEGDIYPEDAKYLKIYDIPTANDYKIDAALMKSAVKTAELGTLTYLQSFCKYDGYYFSTNGSAISKQTSAFAVDSSAAISAGHGNALQLGKSKYAYISGWDDNKIYKIDLDTLVITDTYTLPTTGYTTGVVDETRNRAYVFQRDTTPGDSEESYAFLVIDLSDMSIIESAQTEPVFGAMQAADFFEDRIIVLNGLGTNTIPNGYRIYNIHGEVIGEYVLGSFASAEPEGVCIDRDTHDLLISFSDAKVHIVRQK